MNPRDLPILPGIEDLRSLWPMLIILILGAAFWIYSLYQEHQADRASLRAAEIADEKNERQRSVYFN